MPGGPQIFPGMPLVPQSQPSPSQAHTGMPEQQRGTPGQASPAPNQGLPGTMPGAQSAPFNDPGAMLAQQQGQPGGQSGADGVAQWPSQPPTGMSASPTKSKAANGAGPKTPTAASKPDIMPSKKKRKKTESNVAPPMPSGNGPDVKAPMPQLDGASGPGLMGQAPAPPPPAAAQPPSQPEKQVIPGTQQPVAPPAPPQKHKIEYLPIRRDVHTHGGWDLSLVESQYAPAMLTRGRPRTLRELGLVDVQALIMSLRSRLDFEMSYALNTLLILSAGVGAAPSFQFGLASCEDLLDELLELLEECSFHTSQDEASAPALGSLFVGESSSSRPSKRRRRSGALDALPTYTDWIAVAAEEEAELKIWTRRKASRCRSTAGSVLNGSSEIDSHASISSLSDVLEGTISTNGVESEHERTSEKKAVMALTILTVLKNFSAMPENVFFFNSTPRLVQVLAGICASDEVRVRAAAAAYADEVDTEDGQGCATVFKTAEALRVRKEVLVILSNLAGELLILRTQAPETVRCLFYLLSSFIAGSGTVEELDNAAELAEIAASQPRGAPAPQVVRRIPYHADLALDALSKLALPDDNREVLGSLIDGSDIETLFCELVRALPVTEADFKILNTEHRLGYCERLSMCLYNLAFLSPPAIKQKLRRIPGLSGVVLRIVKKLSKATPEFSRNPFSVLCRRLVEMLRLVSEGEDLFGAPALLGFGFGDGAVGAGIGKVVKKQVGMLLTDEEGVVEILGTNELDCVLSDELFALIASG
nr:conserved hypothetical protein [Melanopsichium pennsylvanicum 4]